MYANSIHSRSVAGKQKLVSPRNGKGGMGRTKASPEIMVDTIE